MRKALRWTCYAVLAFFVIAVLIGFASKHGWEELTVVAVFMAAVIGAMEL